MGREKKDLMAKYGAAYSPMNTLKESKSSEKEEKGSNFSVDVSASGGTGDGGIGGWDKSATVTYTKGFK